mmetsp:Transcript_13158/g.15061  ORF Transcript_13158/g.15061 Transcript_13158/m.15061 type:complete len:210 (-) Transcript_13158:1296-1925(-)
MEYEKRYKPPCSARTVDGIIRGGLVGMAWGIYLPSPITIGSQRSNGVADNSTHNSKEEKAAPRKCSERFGSRSPAPSKALVKVRTKEYNIFAGWQLKQGKFLGLEPVYTSKSVIRYHTTRLAVASLPKAKNIGFSGMAFAGFLGTFSAVTCISESITGKDAGHPLNIFIGGCTAGSLLSLGIRHPSFDLIATTTIGTGLLTSAIHVFLS